MLDPGGQELSSIRYLHADGQGLHPVRQNLHSCGLNLSPGSPHLHYGDQDLSPGQQYLHACGQDSSPWIQDPALCAQPCGALSLLPFRFPPIPIDTAAYLLPIGKKTRSGQKLLWESTRGRPGGGKNKSSSPSESLCFNEHRIFYDLQTICFQYA